jgi:hypothetical protein
MTIMRMAHRIEALGRARRAAGAVLAAPILLLAAGTALAHHGQPDEGDTTIVHACVKKTGAVRIINGATQDCLKGETRAHWDLVGEQGAPGPAGTPGAPGKAGVGILGGTTATALLTGGSDQFLGSFNVDRSRTEADTQLPIPTDGTFSRLYVTLSGSPGAGRSWTFVIRTNGQDTPVTCAIQDLATSCTDLVNPATFNAGDLFSIRVIGSGNPTTRIVKWVGAFEPE